MKYIVVLRGRMPSEKAANDLDIGVQLLVLPVRYGLQDFLEVGYVLFRNDHSKLCPVYNVLEREIVLIG